MAGWREYSSAVSITAGLENTVCDSTAGNGLVMVAGRGTIFVVEPKARGDAAPGDLFLSAISPMRSRGPGSGKEAATAVVGLISAIGGIATAIETRGGSDFAAAA